MCVLIDFDRFCCYFDILGSDFDFLGFWGLFGKCAVLAFHLSLSFYLVGGFC